MNTSRVGADSPAWKPCPQCVTQYVSYIALIFRYFLTPCSFVVFAKKRNGHLLDYLDPAFKHGKKVSDFVQISFRWPRTWKLADYVFLTMGNM